MKKKVAIVIPSLRGGGAERVMVNIIRKLDREKIELKLIVINKVGPYIELLPKDINICDLKSTRLRHSLIKLIKCLNDFKPDVILSTLGHLNLAIIAIKPLLKGSPKIIIREANTPSKDISSKKKLILSFSKYLYPKADLIIAQCKEMKDDLIESLGIDEKHIRYIYNPLDINKIQEGSKSENPFNKDKLNILSVGRLTYQKGFDVLINAFKIVIERFPNAHLTILGEGALKDELQDLAKGLGIRDHISFIGFKDNPYPYYYYADSYILSSRWEGFPNSLLEALACGAKVVATNCKSGPKEILEDNKYGTLVEEGNYESLANGIIQSFSEENKSGNRADSFHINNIIKEYEKVLLQ
ncbi:glycosyltransferase [Schinkia azotoformans]|uniref:glycosyltransferase n=1 Tax=Schinkia azotoformans TaxID=1454 RepID=UPI002E217AEF|nr:glycosyltransferase [Schinkia azotoformans]